MYTPCIIAIKTDIVILMLWHCDIMEGGREFNDIKVSTNSLDKLSL